MSDTINFDSYNQDFLARGRKRILSQFKNAQVLDQLIQALSAESQELYDAILSVLNDRLLDNAKGRQLDILGSLIGQNRNQIPDPTDDAQYLQYIKAKIYKNNTSGASIPEIRYFIKLILDTYEVSFISPNGLLDLWVVVPPDIPEDKLRFICIVYENGKTVSIDYLLPLAATTRLLGVYYKPTEQQFAPDVALGACDLANLAIIIPIPLPES